MNREAGAARRIGGVRGGPGAGREGGGVRDSPGARPRRAAPPAAPLASLPWRFYTSRSLAWRFCTLRARAARNNAAAMEPACNNAAAMEPARRNAAPPSFARRNKSRTTPAESMATLRHRYRHSIRLSVQFVATDCMTNRRRSVSSRLGHLYVSKERQGPGRPNRRRPHGMRTHASSHLGRLCVSCATCQCPDVGRPPTREGAALPRRPRTPSTRQASAQKRPAPRGCGPTKAGCKSISRRWK